VDSLEAQHAEPLAGVSPGGVGRAGADVEPLAG
jgi:hypothetical protein